MKKTLILILSLTIFLILPVFTAEKNIESIKNEIKVVLDDSEKGWNTGNIEQYMECYRKSEKMRFAGNGNFNFGWENTLKRYKKSYPDKEAMGRLSFSDVDITVISNDAALVFGRWTLRYPDKEKTGLYTLLLRKFDEGWRIVHDHSSSAK